MNDSNMTQYTPSFLQLTETRELKSRKSKRSSLQNSTDKVFFPCRHKRIINRESVDNNGTVESLSICRTWSREALKSLSLNWDEAPEITLTGNCLCTGLSLRNGRRRKVNTQLEKGNGATNATVEWEPCKLFMTGMGNEPEACCLLSPTSHPSAKKLFILKKRYTDDTWTRLWSAMNELTTQSLKITNQTCLGFKICKIKKLRLDGV